MCMGKGLQNKKQRKGEAGRRRGCKTRNRERARRGGGEGVAITKNRERARQWGNGQDSVINSKQDLWSFDEEGRPHFLYPCLKNEINSTFCNFEEETVCVWLLITTGH